jgi:hypothetical protein
MAKTRHNTPMLIRGESRSVIAFLLATSLACSPAQALVSLNDGRDRIHVSASVSITRDSNIFANSDDRGDVVYSTGLSVNYTRRAGWIGVNGSASVGSSKFATIDGQDFVNPSFGLEFTKQSGRTTGSLTLSAAKESRADSAVNTRSTSWNIPIGLNFKYPITGTNTLSGGMGYSSRRYLDESAFTSLSTYNASADLYHILSTEREMIAGYRYRFTETSRKTSSTDHALTLGVSGKLLRGFTGSLRAGYQTRVPKGYETDEGKFGSWTASGTTTYAINKKLNLNGSIAKDFATTATDSIVDSTTFSLEAQYAYSSHWGLLISSSFGDSAFLGEGGRVIISLGPPLELGKQRHDNYLTWSAVLNYSLNEHFKAGLTYSWFKQWSTFSYADFVRSSWALNFSTTW